MADPTLQELNAQAMAHHQTGRLDQAEALFRRIVASPAGRTSAHAHYNLALALRSGGRLEDAGNPGFF